MSTRNVFARTAPDLVPVLEELRRFEPIFHTAAFGRRIGDFERRLAPDYWEVGASGRCYSREFILQHLKENPPADAAEAGWQTCDHALRSLGSDTYLLTYTLRQGERVTRRATVWRRLHGDWTVLYHQGTIVSGEEHDIAPSEGT